MIGEHIGPYRLLSPLGGDAGAVHRATGPKGRDVAIRMLPEGAAPDIAAMREVRSPYVVDVLDGGSGPGGAYVVSRLVPGRPLAEVVAECGPAAGEELRRTALGLAKALAAIHLAGLAHGDLHPGAVLVVDGSPVAVDFGLAAGADAAGDVRAWADVVAFAAGGPAAVPGALRPLLAAAAAADPAARPSPAELAEAVSRVEPLPGPAPEPAPRQPAPSAAPAPAVPEPRPVAEPRTDAPERRLAVAHGWARLFAAMVVVVAVGVAMMMPVVGLVLSLVAVTWLRAVAAVSFKDWAMAFGRTLPTVPYAAALTVAVPPALVAASMFGVEIDSLAACAFGAGAGAAVLWTAPGVRGPRRRLERMFLRVVRAPAVIAVVGAALAVLMLLAVVGALSLTPSFAPLYGMAGSLENTLDRLHGAFDRF